MIVKNGSGDGMGQYFRFGDVSASTVADRVKEKWTNLILTLKDPAIDARPDQIASIPSNSSIAFLTGLATKGDETLRRRKSPNAGILQKTLNEAVEGAATPTSAVAEPSASSKFGIAQILPMAVGALFLGWLIFKPK